MKLIKFLQRLTGEAVTIELKNGTVIVGTVVGIDASMNAHLRKVKMTLKSKNPQPYATLSVRGSTVRSILLPESLNLDALLVDAADSGKPKNIAVNRAGLAPVEGVEEEEEGVEEEAEECVVVLAEEDDAAWICGKKCIFSS
eukprot:CAMPEP_0113312538 /NCGR_PEP_ID=MMETSP0010_2-20120614/9337_1 /TAXON_ID=216773 ORGANISM="Corethron hystrix, Strain 308" /NCGR_SAMPLE_ID=MMETSP0010_2 /ASSEMBLY_ACC=CAM_ASM_000155 /LENGTH=141 /DNA_ID=CAMNT_0000168401 /DNA_START=110 /DNA_END=536 /DNA_ORIENTATION=- /assembly_acc=CAM_ASM_000155